MQSPYLICELANSHGGDADVIRAQVAACAKLPVRPLGVKFQILKPDRIALPDFPWYSVYETLYQPPGAWDAILAQAADADLDIWLDLFDTYGVEVLAAHAAKVAGVKLQASVIENEEVLKALEAVDLQALTLLLNVSGHELGTIAAAVRRISELRPRRIVLQVGFQHYPTAVEDTGLQKLAVLRAAFPDLPLCMADHVDASDPFARRIPLLAVALGCAFVEKHFCLSRKDAPYDGFSALEPAEMAELAVDLPKAAAAFGSSFIGAHELEYLRKSVQIPVAREPLKAGSLAASGELLFRRTSGTGLSLAQVDQIQRQRFLLAQDVPALRPIPAGAFRPARIAVIVAGRMKSSRLRQKAVLPIAGVPSVERCLSNCLLFPNAEFVVLATSTLEEDAILGEHTLGGKVKFWRGDPDDVIMRYLGACEAYGIDVIIRVTADCPCVSPEIAGRLLESHFANGADYTAPREFAVGSNSEVYNTRALRQVIEHLGKADHSEYMTWYLKNNPDVFKVNLVDLPSDLLRDYRLTLDYPEDLEMFEALYRELDVRGQDARLPNVFRVLDDHPGIAQINAHLTVKYRSDPELIERLNRVTRIVKPPVQHDGA